MANLITEYTNGTFEGVLASWGATFTVASSAQVRDDVEFFEGIHSVKLTSIELTKSFAYQGFAPYLIINFPASQLVQYEVTVRVKVSEDFPDNAVLFLSPAANLTQPNKGYVTPVRANQAKDGWVELKANFYAQVSGGQCSFYVSVLIDEAAFKYSYGFVPGASELYAQVYNYTTADVTIPAGAFIWIDAATAEQKRIPAVLNPQFVGRRLYYVRDVFYMVYNGVRTVIDEPIKWSDIEIETLFDKTAKGYRFEFSDKDILLQFDNRAGREILQLAYKLDGTNADVKILFGEFDPVSEQLTIHYTGAVNFQSWTDDEFVCQANIELASFDQKITTYYDTDVDIFRLTTLQGLALNPITKSDLFLHPQLLSHIYKSIYNKNVNVSQEFDPQPVPGGLGGDAISFVIIPPFKSTANNVEGMDDPTPPDGTLVYAGLNLPVGVAERVFFIEGKLSFKYHKSATIQRSVAGVGVFKVSGIANPGATPDGVYIPLGITEGPVFVGFAEEGPLLAGFHTVNAQFSGQIALKADEALFVRVSVLNPVAADPGPDVYDQFVFLNTGSHYLNISEQTVFPPSLVKAPRIFEVFKRQLEIVTDTLNVLKSDFLGRIDLGYDADGCAANHFNMNGKIIRGLLGKPFNASTKKLITSLDCVFNTGMSIERDDDGNQWVRLEEMPYFFRNILLFDFQVISEYKSVPANDFLFSELEFGPNKYPTDNQPDSLDDFLTKFNYTTPLFKIKNKLSKVFDALLSGYYIEYTRQQSFAVNPTNAYETDEDLFYISARTTAVSANGLNITFSADGNLITINKLMPIVANDFLKIANKTGSIVNGLYFITEVFISFDYESMTLKTVLISDGTGTGDVTIADSLGNAVADRFQAKRDEDFDTIEGVPFPKSTYNLEHHIARIKARWAKYFSAGWAYLYRRVPTYQGAGTPFTKGLNNINVSTILKSSVQCIYGDYRYQGTIWGKKDSDNFGSINILDRPIFDKDQISFNAPLTWTQVNYIRKAFEGRNPDGRDYGFLQWRNPKGVIERGYILTMKFKPVTQICSFTLIQKFDG
jgi:hypothetical protein